MPSEPTLSEWIAMLSGAIDMCILAGNTDELSGDDPARLREAAAKLASYEQAEKQPEVAELLEIARMLAGDGELTRSEAYIAHAAALVRLAEQEAALERVRALVTDFASKPATRARYQKLLRELDAALGGEEGGDK